MYTRGFPLVTAIGKELHAFVGNPKVKSHLLSVLWGKVL
jgi:hypothetical protein